MSNANKPLTFRKSESWYFDDAPGLLVDVVAQLNEYLDRAGPLYRDKVEFDVESDYYTGHAGHATLSYNYTETQEEADARVEAEKAEKLQVAARRVQARAAAEWLKERDDKREYERLKAKFESSK